jgi:hypothetical protein
MGGYGYGKTVERFGMGGFDYCKTVEWQCLG